MKCNQMCYIFLQYLILIGQSLILIVLLFSYLVWICYKNISNQYLSNHLLMQDTVRPFAVSF